MQKKEMIVSNYCACFIDLLGQRNALSGQNLLPVTSNEEQQAMFYDAVLNSVGAISRLQQQAESFRFGASGEPEYVQHLQPEDREIYEKMTLAKSKQQRWSDGLVLYQSLDFTKFPCPMGSIADLFMQAGSLCLIGLASKQPIRGGIEVSWGAELHDNELYGAVVANSYELEGKIAKYPRIVVGEYAMKYLDENISQIIDGGDKLAQFNKDMAIMCKNMLATDSDGQLIVDYLGDAFTAYVMHGKSHNLYNMARVFVCEQLEAHKANENIKLVERYELLLSYFDRNVPKNA